MKKNAEKNGKAVRIESLDELQAMVNEPVLVSFGLNGKVIEVPCRRVSQEVDEQVRALMRKAQPPYDVGRKDHNYLDAKYQAERDLNKAMARSLVVYAGCPAIAAKKPGLTSAPEIHAFVKTLLTENILEFIALSIQQGGMELIDRTNFTSPATLES